MSAESDVLENLRSSGALKEGHFLLSSGKHSDRYVEKFDLLRQPRATSRVCEGFANAFREASVDVVVGPTTGGIILAFEVARQLGVASAYAERKSAGPGREIRRGTVFTPGTRALVVDDILTTGGSVRETLDALADHPVEIVGVGILVDRSGGNVDFGVPMHALARMEIATWEPATCPLCAQGIALVKPGTTPGAGSV